MFDPDLQKLLQTEGYVHSVETAGTVDGPGIRFVIFLTGCPLRCAYCHNPDTQKLTDGKKMTALSLVEEMNQYKDFLQITKGGLTVTGGEPLFQPEFLLALFKGAKALGISTALDTSGFLGAKASDELLDATDLVLLDIKAFEDDLYRKVTGAALKPTLEFAERLGKMGKKMWIRYVLVPNLTDDLPSIEKLAVYVKNLGSVERVEILPFHKMGEEKWESLKLPYTLKETQPPTPELTEKVRDLFRAQGLMTV